MLYEFYNAFLADPYISSLNPEITFYTYPDYENFEGVHIVIDPIQPPKPADFADGVWVTEEHFYFIEVWTKDRDTTANVARVLQDVLNKQFLFRQFGSGVDEFDKEYSIFRDSRKYRGKKNLI